MKPYCTRFLQENANHSQALLAAIQFGISESVRVLGQGWASEPIIRKAKARHPEQNTNQTLSPPLRESNSVFLGWGLGILFFHRFYGWWAELERTGQDRRR